ncbi:hypothetical protein M011DRAFT_464753 [Sporormia fimetaria CBS 119925]|uniref:Uncharacterized protein n=3 Tax=Sporormia fimetaria CBS 119925 TaxID=1340428 RepID=A0A6A6VME8_9PLEO|nr:hypothetical protein M011DRAFT_472478 [Sporormia fimetaria CBS 119925]KAF2749773.1 hypothetical protein M011DRAFT_465438 [Sporormia fimetaria CBS 119925]KAF2750966.1 hypothetical protein M011DRAFT_464753 [Sporormia fimetaria CBS 119925]
MLRLLSAKTTDHTEHCCSVPRPVLMRAFSSHVTVPRVEVSHLCFSMSFAPSPSFLSESLA